MFLYSFSKTKILIIIKTNGVKKSAINKLWIPFALFTNERICFKDSKSVKNKGTKIKTVAKKAKVKRGVFFTALERYVIMYAPKKKKKNDKSQREKIKIFINVTNVNKNP